MLLPLTILVLIFGMNSCSKILGVFPIPSLSHQIVYRGLMLELNRRGHEVTVITPDPLGDPNLKNYREISVRDKPYEYIRNIFKNLANDRMNYEITEWTLVRFLDMANNFCEFELSEPEVQKLIKSDEKFDLVIVEYLSFPCMNAFSHRFNASLMGMSSLGLYPIGYDIIRATNNPAIDSFLFLPFFGPRTVLEKVRCVFYVIWNKIVYHWWVVPKQDAIARKYFGDDIPYVGDMDGNVSLVLANTDFTTLYPRANVPNLVEFGGGNAVHFKKEVKELPKVRKECSRRFLGIRPRSQAIPFLNWIKLDKGATDRIQTTHPSKTFSKGKF